MKPGWREIKLEEAAFVGAGNPAPQDEALFEGGKYPFFRTSDVGKIRFGEVSVSVDLLNDQGAAPLRLIPGGTVLMPKSGASTFLNHRVITGVDGYVSSHLATVTAKKGIADARYLLYALSRVRAQDLLAENSYPSLNLSVVKNIFIPLPNLEEQRRIAAALDAVFEGLDRAKTHIESNLADANELIEGELGRVFSKKRKGWTVGKIGDICTLKSGKTVSKNRELPAGGIPYVKVGDMNLEANSSGITTSTRFLDREAISHSQVFPKGTTIFPKRGGAIMTNKKRIVLKEICADLNVMGVIPARK